MITGLLNSMLASATPILLASLGGAFTYHCDVFNIAMEGMLLAGAFGAVAVGFATGSWLAAIGGGILAAAILGFLFVVFAVWLDADEFVTGIALNLLALGTTTYLLRQWYGVKGAFDDPSLPAIPDVDLPWLEPIPVIGPVLSGRNLLVWVGLFAAVATWWVVQRSRYGLRLRAAGFNPPALEASGGSVARVRAIALVACSVTCGMGGAFLSLGYLTLFNENMSAGRGWIALAAVILVRGSAPGIVAISLLFGFADGLGLQLQTRYGLAPQFTAMAPYLATLFVLFFYARRKLGESP